MADALALTEDDLVRMEHRARRFQGAWTGTSGTLAADVMRLLAERRRLLAVIGEVSRSSAASRKAVAPDPSAEDRGTSGG